MTTKGATKGGARVGAGRKKLKPEDGVPDGSMGKGFASNIFSRIHELKLKALGADGKPIGEIKTADDYALEILRPMDAEARNFFKLLLAYKHGKPVQPVITADTRENIPELEFGNLVMPAAPKSGTAGKPN